ncbi:uncharacterized [Tachysurus ichikawai]
MEYTMEYTLLRFLKRLSAARSMCSPLISSGHAKARGTTAPIPFGLMMSEVNLILLVDSRKLLYPACLSLAQ